MNVITKSVQLPDGRTITIETGKVAKQADGAAVLRMGNTVLLATVCAAKDAVPGTDFMPLQVDYREQYSAAGRFPGGFTKREGKASDEEILTSRLVDRALRPLFPSNYHAEVYVQVMLLSADGVDQPDALTGFAASAAMACSDIPFEHYISEVRVARINGEYVVNPTFQQMEEADMDIMVGATKDNIMMVEGEMKEVSEQDLIGALKAAAEAIKPMCELQYELAKEKGTDVKREYDHEINDEELREQIKSELYKPAYDINHQALEKHARQDAFDKVLADFLEKYDAAHSDLSEEDLEEKHAEATRYYDDVMRDAMRRCILDEGLRLDGRATTDIRPIWCEVSPLPMPHGSPHGRKAACKGRKGSGDGPDPHRCILCRHRSLPLRKDRAGLRHLRRLPLPADGKPSGPPEDQELPEPHHRPDGERHLGPHGRQAHARRTGGHEEHYRL